MKTNIKEYYDKLRSTNSPLKRIKAKCIDCSAYQWKEVKLCPVKDCPLWDMRNGHKNNR